jgi:bla regulator protein blaR1
MTALVLHALVVALLLAAAASLSEVVLRALRLPARWTWGAAMAGTVALGTWAIIGPAPTGGGPLAHGLEGARATGIMGDVLAAASAPGDAAWVAQSMKMVGYIAGVPAAVLARGDGLLPSLSPTTSAALGLAWGTGSLLLLALLLGGGLHHARARRSWPRIRIHGETARLSPGHTPTDGPAVAGLLQPEIILPRWALKLPAEELRLVLRHEAEHRRARDPQLLAAAAFLVALFPWNPVLWWQLRRLRDAVEVDCDARVLRTEAARRPYAELLLRVGARRSALLPSPAGSASPFAFPGIRGSTSQLERRLHAMRPPSARPLPLAAAATAALLLVASACVADRPTPVEIDPTATPALTVTEPAMDEAGREPLAGAQVIELDGVGVSLSGEEIRVSGDPLGEGDVRIRVRTASGTMSSPASDPETGPLIVVDGVILARGTDRLQALDPTDIESIEILKGEAARHLFGERATHGVIRVRTKGGGEERP